MKKAFSKFFIKMTVVSFLLISSAFIVSQYNHYKDLRRHYLNTAQRISQSLSSQFSFYYHNIQNISFNSALQDLNRQTATEYFDSLIALYPNYDMLLLTDDRGKYIASNTIGSEGESLKLSKIKNSDFASSAWYKEASSNNLSEDFKKGLWGAGARDFESSRPISELYGKDKFGMHLSSPVRNSKGKLVGYVTSFINEKWLRKELKLLSREFFGQEEEHFDAFIVNKDNKTLASNQSEELSPLSSLPFVMETANFSLHYREGNFFEGAGSFLKFVQHPFYIVSKFNHQNFLSELGWSLVLRMNKEQALSSIINSFAWFWSAFLIFVFTGVGLKFKALSKFESLEETSGEAKKELLEKELDKANLNGIFQSLSDSMVKAKNISLENRESADGKEPNLKTLKMEGPGPHEENHIGAIFNFLAFVQDKLKNLGRDHSHFSFLLQNQIKSRKEAQSAATSLEWNIEKAGEALDELKMSALNIEIGAQSGSCPALFQASQTRNLDALIERSRLYLGETARIGKFLQEENKLREEALKNHWRDYDQKFGSSCSAAEKSLHKANISLKAIGEGHAKSKAQARAFKNVLGAFKKEKEFTNGQAAEFLKELERMERLLLAAQTILGQDGLSQKSQLKKAS